MRKLFLLLLLLAAPCLAKGPKYNQTDDPLLQDELENVYKDIGNVLKGDVRISSVTITSATIMNTKGRTDASAPCSGCIGQSISSATVNVSFGASTAWSDCSTLFIPSGGDWGIWGGFETSAVTLVTDVEYGISTTSGNSGTGLVVGFNRFSGFLPNATVGSSGIAPELQASLTAGTSYYLKVIAIYGGTTPLCSGTLWARRRS